VQVSIQNKTEKKTRYSRISAEITSRIGFARQEFDERALTVKTATRALIVIALILRAGRVALQMHLKPRDFNGRGGVQDQLRQ
jgi:hypothetical protein